MKRYIKASQSETDDRVKDALDVLDDDYGYVVSGIERLARTGATQDALSLISELSNSLNTIISSIAGFETR